jgi:hypothetical protein
VRLPTYRFIVTQDFVCYELVVSGERPHLSYCYRPCAFTKVFEPTQRAPWRSLKPSETMIRVGHRCFLVTHACVDACHCPHCGADVGVLCVREPRGGGARRLNTSTHYQRRDLYRAALRKR